MGLQESHANSTGDRECLMSGVRGEERRGMERRWWWARLGIVDMCVPDNQIQVEETPTWSRRGASSSINDQCWMETRLLTGARCSSAIRHTPRRGAKEQRALVRQVARNEGGKAKWLEMPGRVQSNARRRCFQSWDDRGR